VGLARCGTVPRVCGGWGGCAGGGVPLGAVPVLSWCGEVSLGGKQSLSRTPNPQPAGGASAGPGAGAAGVAALGLTPDRFPV